MHHALWTPFSTICPPISVFHYHRCNKQSRCFSKLAIKTIKRIDIVATRKLFGLIICKTNRPVICYTNSVSRKQLTRQRVVATIARSSRIDNFLKRVVLSNTIVITCCTKKRDGSFARWFRLFVVKAFANLENLGETKGLPRTRINLHTLPPFLPDKRGSH